MTKASDRLIVNTKGTCPHCGEKRSHLFFDNAEDEYAWCYTCGNHSTNPLWKSPLRLVHSNAIDERDASN